MGICAAAAMAQGQNNDGSPADPNAAQILQLANQARAQAGAPPLAWSSAVAKAAMAHCQKMVEEGPIAHRYGGEASVSGRVAAAGGHFSLIEENVALGQTPGAIHNGWMNSPEHRENLLNPKVDHVGVAVVATRGVLYAVADYIRAVPVLEPEEAEAKIGRLVRVYGLRVLADPSTARKACAMEKGIPNVSSGPQPMGVVRWQNANLAELPPNLVARLKSGQFKLASVGNCPAQDVEGDFSTYRFAVVLYESPAEGGLRPSN